MKKKTLFAIAAMGLSITSVCQNKESYNNETPPETQDSVISSLLRFCESTYPYQEGILIANFGTDELNPLNTEGKGYIVYAKNGQTEKLIPADGNLSAPKGMLIQANRLFICDVNKIVVYNLGNLKEAPQTISFPKDDLFLNDLVAVDNILYASVTNSGRIYRIDISSPATLSQSVPKKWMDIAGPNGMIINNRTLYVASYPADGNTTNANVIYEITNWAKPIAKPFITVAGQYDGIAMSANGKKMYITNWSPAEVSEIDMQSKKIAPLDMSLEKKLIGPADITVVGKIMYIPDLPNSRVVVKNL